VCGSIGRAGRCIESGSSCVSGGGVWRAGAEGLGGHGGGGAAAVKAAERGRSLSALQAARADKRGCVRVGGGYKMERGSGGSEDTEPSGAGLIRAPCLPLHWPGWARGGNTARSAGCMGMPKAADSIMRAEG